MTLQVTIDAPSQCTIDELITQISGWCASDDPEPISMALGWTVNRNWCRGSARFCTVRVIDWSCMLLMCSLRSNNSEKPRTCRPG
jgi:hypothetical protein